MPQLWYVGYLIVIAKKKIILRHVIKNDFLSQERGLYKNQVNPKLDNHNLNIMVLISFINFFLFNIFLFNDTRNMVILALKIF